MNAKYIVKKPTCYESLSDPSCVDLIITSSSNFFKYEDNIKGLIGFSQNGYNCFKTNFSKIITKGASV